MKKLLSVLLAFVLVFSLCACGNSSDSLSSPAAYDTGKGYELAASDNSRDFGGMAAAEAPASVAGGADDSSDAPNDDPSKIIYSASVTVETTVFEESLASLAALVEKHGGWIESSSVNGQNFSDISRGYTRLRSASYRLRIPSAEFDVLMGKLPELGNVPYSYTYTENVSAQYYDVEARLTAYTTQEARLLEMMEKAGTIADVIIIEDKLSELRYQIDSLQSALNSWDRSVSYSSIDLSIEEVREYSPDSTVTISYGQQLLHALERGLDNAVDFFADLLLGIVSILPSLIILAVLAAVIVPLTLRSIKKRRAKKQNKSEPENPAGDK